jgi:hypothetical protein
MNAVRKVIRETTLKDPSFDICLGRLVTSPAFRDG